jgi:ribonuclease HII
VLEKYLYEDTLEAGCDEAGRGCLAGAVYAAAVILPPNFECELLDDSKKIKEKDRIELRTIIKREALAWAIGVVSQKEIDEINILNASFLAMHRAIDQLKLRPEYLLIDGNRFTPYPKINHDCIIKGDAKYMSIAAASILAKTYRDDYMAMLDAQHPEYDWKQNKGYPTKGHRRAIVKHGQTSYHRKTFQFKTDDL